MKVGTLACAAGLRGTTPLMERAMRIPIATLLIAGCLVTSGIAQTTTTGEPAAPDAKSSQQSGGQQSVTRPNTDKMTTEGGAGAGAGNVKLEEGANSFTEGQVRSRLDDAGFKDAKDLKKGDDGIWRGAAMHNGKSVKVGLDFKGNIAVQ